MGWCFAIVNGRLSEIFFDGRGNAKRVWGHCYVHRNNYVTKQERNWIEQDTKRSRFVYRNKTYRVCLPKPTARPESKHQYRSF